MQTSFPPDILICTDRKYPAPGAYINEDALQLVVDALAESDPDGGWEMHDTSEDELLRARRVQTENGESAIYEARLPEGGTKRFRVFQIDRYGRADVEVSE